MNHRPIVDNRPKCGWCGWRGQPEQFKEVFVRYASGVMVNKRLNLCPYCYTSYEASQQSYSVCMRCGATFDGEMCPNCDQGGAGLAASSADTQNACGAESAGAKRKPRAKLSAVKQEPNALDASA